MAASIYERHETRDWSITATGGNVVREFIVLDTTSETEAYAITRALAPLFDFGMVRISLTGEFQGGRTWFTRVEYGPGDPINAAGLSPEEMTDLAENPTGGGGGGGFTETLDIGGSFSADITGEEVQIYRSLQTITMINAGAGGGAAAAPDNKLAIGVTEDGIEGTTITRPVIQWQRQVTRPSVTMSYLRTLAGLCGKVNYSAPFYSWEAGEVLYIGASLSRGTENRWTVTHRFASRENQTDVVISADGDGAPLIKIPTLNGWDYVWVRYRDDAANDKRMKLPVSAYVERIYKTGTFADLEIGQ